MQDPCTIPLAFALDASWAIPVLGVAAAGLAFALSRRFLVARRAPAPTDPGDLADSTFLQGVTVDRRRAPRRKGNSVEVYLSDGAGGAPLDGWVVDRSVGGLCLLVAKPVAAGTVLKVRARRAPESIPWAAIEVRTCRPEGGDWELNCGFAETPSWNVLLHFG
jgi:hypothetical protein